jgi:O-antigen/teichoic acid export membrane protein
VTEENLSEPIQDEQKQYLSKVTKEAGFAFTGKVFGLLFGFVAQVIFARLLGADILGVFVLAWTIVFGVTILTTLGFELSLVRFMSKYHSSGRPREARAVCAPRSRTGSSTSTGWSGFSSGSRSR